MKYWKRPPPTNEDNINERRRKKIVGIVRHNEPAKSHTVNLLYSKSYPHKTLEGVLEELLDEGYIRYTEDGYVVTDLVE